MNWFALDEFSVADLALTMDSLAPSGNYKSMFWVSDWANHFLSFTENFTVDNDEPVADAGPDFAAVVNTTITLDASASYDNIGIVNYTWWYTDPDGVTVYLYGETVETLIWETGSYEFALMVEDGAFLVGFDYVTVEVTPDAPPVADAGPDMTVDEDTDFAFDGSASYDDVGIDNYTWYVVEMDVYLYGETPGFNIADSGVYTVELVVTDTLGQVSAPYVLSLTVLDITAPTADAGLDRTVDMGAVVHFNGTGSSDNVGIVNYTWNFTDAADVTLYGIGPTYQFDNAGEFVVTLTVADGGGSTATDTMTVTVIDTEAPVANAGADQTVDMGATVTLNASLSSDNVGIADYVWTFTYDGTEETLTGMVQSYAFELPGVYTVTLNVTDAAGNYATDTVVITVHDTELPTADAGTDIDAIAGEEVTFDGTGSSDNVGIAEYSWAFIDSTSQVLHTATPSYTFDTAGEYIVTLTVTDDDGNIDTDTVTVRVTAANAAPVADAGIDQTASAGDPVTFDGAGSTDDVEVTNYTWTFTYDGSVVTLYGAAPTFVFDVAGTYTVTLTVTDADDLSDTDTVDITVQESSKTFIENYWWLLVVVAVVVVAGVVLLTMGKGKGRTPSKVDEDEDVEDAPPAPPEDEEL
jgi:PKD repeat protein